MQFIDTATTRRHLGFAPLIAALHAMFVGDCEVPTRHTHRVAGADGGGTLLLMPAWRAGKKLGIKTVTIFPGNSALGKPGLHSTYLLFDAATGEPLAQLDGNEITSRRTAAASALAASFLARADAGRLLVVGTGRVAQLMAEAMCAVRPITDVQVWNHRPASALALAERLRDDGFAARAVDDLNAAVGSVDIISCATLSIAPLIRGAWLCPGTHLDLVGSFTPQMREADAECFARSRVFVDTEEALSKSGDLLQAMAEGRFSADHLQATLADLCVGRHAGRCDATERTLFKSVGTALEDLAAAELVWSGVARESLSCKEANEPGPNP
jgi:ornithine cyclodeaminase